MENQYYLGIDLGTTNSTAAVFDGTKSESVRDARGAVLTPSLVRISKNGSVSVGERALRFIESDAANVRGGFKRLMGTQEKILFPASGASATPEELSAHVIRALLDQTEQRYSVRPRAAVITVPALFEVPQAAATKRAAQSVGLEQVELIQEPVASALASGWSEAANGRWLVYDLGGGTFDVSLVEGSDDGLLRVVGHDGDNFLGGRDIDRAIVRWIVTALQQQGSTLSQKKPEHQAALRSIGFAAEQAKIELSSADETWIAPAAPLEIDGEELEIELRLDRATFEQLCQPLIERSLEVCTRLLQSHALSSADIARVVLVGGPTAMPLLRQRVHERFGELASEQDPMTVVAHGAALFAASSNLEFSSRKTRDSSAAATAADPNAVELWLQFPSVSSDPEPHVVGRLAHELARIKKVLLEREDGSFSDQADIEEDGTFVLSTSLHPKQITSFNLRVMDDAGEEHPASPSQIRITHGVTIGAPPLARSIGVALANNRVREYFGRGTPLPTKRTFSQRLIESVGPGAAQETLVIPIVQGEFDEAHLCRQIGALRIRSEELKSLLPAGTKVELSLSLDRGGGLAARAFIPATGQSFEDIASLLVPECNLDVLRASLGEFDARLAKLRRESYAGGLPEGMTLFMSAQRLIENARQELEAAEGNDSEAAQQARRCALEAEAQIHDAEQRQQWETLIEDTDDEIAVSRSWVEEFGSDNEKRMLETTVGGIERAIRSQSSGQLRRRLRRLRELTHACRVRAPGYWEDRFEYAKNLVGEMNDPAAANRLIAEGEKADKRRLQEIVRSLWTLLPADVEERAAAYGSSVQ